MNARILSLIALLAILMSACSRAASTPPASVEVTRIVTVEIPVSATPNFVATNIALPTSTPVVIQPSSTPVAIAEPADLWTNPASAIAFFDLKYKDGQSLKVTDLQDCPAEEATAKCYAILVSPIYADNPWPIWIEAFRENPGVARPGNYPHPELSGLPPMSQDILLDSGLTLRPQEDYDKAPGSGMIGWNVPLTSIDIAGFPASPEIAANFYHISNDQADAWLAGEKNQIVFRPKNEGGTLLVKNGACWQDGQRVTPGIVRPGYEKEELAKVISIPPNYEGFVYEFNLRGCKADQAAMLAGTNTTAPTAVSTASAVVTDSVWPTTPAEVISFFNVSGLDESKIHVHPDEGAPTWEVLLTDRFHFENTSGCAQDGAYIINNEEKYKIPAGFVGESSAFTVRPCP